MPVALESPGCDMPQGSGGFSLVLHTSPFSIHDQLLYEVGRKYRLFHSALKISWQSTEAAQDPCPEQRTAVLLSADLYLCVSVVFSSGFLAALVTGVDEEGINLLLPKVSLKKPKCYLSMVSA